MSDQYAVADLAAGLAGSADPSASVSRVPAYPRTARLACTRFQAGTTFSLASACLRRSSRPESSPLRAPTKKAARRPPI
jgi:hypothetical protein